MSWSSGSELAGSIIRAYEKNSGGASDKEKWSFYRELIVAFEGFDCDTLDECRDISPQFNRAFVYPEEVMSSLLAAYLLENPNARAGEQSAFCDVLNEIWQGMGLIEEGISIKQIKKSWRFKQAQSRGATDEEGIYWSLERIIEYCDTQPNSPSLDARIDLYRRLIVQLYNCNIDPGYLRFGDSDVYKEALRLEDEKYSPGDQF